VAISFDTMATRYDVDRDMLAAELAGEPAYRVAQVWDGLYRQNVDIEAMTDLPRALRSQLAERLPPALSLVREQTSDGGTTVKLLLAPADGGAVDGGAVDGGAVDGGAIETVLMHYPARTTVCVSTQAGCAMACGFCATGQAGFERQLTTGEIVEQIVWARRRSAPRRVSNVVFMGMGEPLANYDAVWAAVDRLHGAMGVSARHLTVSTVGIVPGIRRLATERLPVNLAVSLHAANDTLRDRLVPVNRRYPLASLRAACEEYLRTKSRRLSFEWALIDGVNDRPAHAAELAAYARPLHAHVNLIPLNPTPGFATRGTPPAGVREFRARVQELGVNVTVRRNRGTDIDAACGQLAGAVNAPARLSARRP